MNVFCSEERCIKRFFLTGCSRDYELVIFKILGHRNHYFQHFFDFLFSAAGQKRNNRAVIQAIFIFKSFWIHLLSIIDGVYQWMSDKMYGKLVFFLIKILFKGKNGV